MLLTKKTAIFLLLISLHLFPQGTIQSRISAILSKARAAKYSVLIINPLSNDTLYAANSSRLMTPASVTKLYTTITAISLMGPNYQIAVRLFTENKNIVNGTIDGNLYIKGYGNSLFSTEDLREMVQALKQKGVSRITGKIIGDDSYFDDEYSRRDWIEDEPGANGIPPVSALVLDRNSRSVASKGRRGRIRISHSLVQNPPLFVAQRLREELKAVGIQVGGEAAAGVTPKGAAELVTKGPLLKDLIKIVNKRSDNFLAECLFKTIGAYNSKVEGSAFYASQAEKEFLFKNDIVIDGGEIVDGSGLSHFNQVSVRSIVNLLEWAYTNLPSFDDFVKSLSISSEDGTLRGRMQGSNAAEHFFGKTGTVNGVSTIAGYLKCANGDELIVGIMFEFGGGRPTYYRRLQDEIIETASGYKFDPER